MAELEKPDSRFQRDWRQVEEDRYIRKWLRRKDGTIPLEYAHLFDDDSGTFPDFNIYLETFEDGY